MGSPNRSTEREGRFRSVLDRQLRIVHGGTPASQLGILLRFIQKASCDPEPVFGI